MKVLVTGGAGFIGRHLCRRLLAEGCEVSVLDCFSAQVHCSRELDADLVNKVKLKCGDVRDEASVEEALRQQDVIVHFAAETGTGQSMYEITRYQSVNIGGTATLLHHLVNKPHRVKKIVVASSRAVYGEGHYYCPQHGSVYPLQRRTEDLKVGQFEPRCPACGTQGSVRSTGEEAPFQPSSFYGLTKQVQEQMVLMFARALGISAYALRYQNVYGPGQSLNNPYTGILAIFSNQARAQRPINIFEDGKESRDFVYIDDVVEATWRCVASDHLAITSLNIGSGNQTSVLEVVEEILEFFDSKSTVSVTGAFRQGDIRHNFADLTKAREEIGYHPKWQFSDGCKEFLKWAASQPEIESGYIHSLAEMKAKRLYHE